jgi:hypothetical protein
MQKKGLRRNTIDKYYTKPEIALQCIDLFRTHIDILSTDVVIEPSAGAGAFVNPIRGIPCANKAYDIAPEDPTIETQDYLVFDPIILSSYEKIHIVGNPPFGRQSSLAIQFIKKSCEFADTVAFILPKSFKKDSMQRAFTPQFHKICEWDLPDNSFLVDGNDHDVPCVFQIWRKSEEPRVLKEKVEPRGFRFVKKGEPHDIAFRRVGVNAGVIHRDTVALSEQSHYFIVFTNGKSVDVNIRQLSSIRFSHDNTVGPRSISKQELCAEYNRVL